MTSQINGLNQAAQNANDGVSLTQTASGALGEVTNDLQTMRDLAVESLNATNSATDRADLNAQFQQLIADINSVASNTQFNGVNLLDGTFQGADLPDRRQRRPDHHRLLDRQRQGGQPRCAVCGCQQRHRWRLHERQLRRGDTVTLQVARHPGRRHCDQLHDQRGHPDRQCHD